ncbi:hypothetical protein BH11MYX3_BH11MYX3_09560 [soil metagenome]
MAKHLPIAMALALVAGCPQRIDRKVGTTLQTVDMEAPFLKCHMKDGGLYVLQGWRIDEPTGSVTGAGEYFGTDRSVESRSTYRVRLADVALYETNTIVTSPGVAAMAVITGVSLAVTAACIANPKACFGSCPTFYAPADDGGRSVLQAEGFSDAISPALETHDIDALWRTTGHGGAFTLTMTNEAYETHVVKQADLLAVPRPPGGRVLATAETLWIASRVAAPTACQSADGDCTRQLAAVDASERISLTDEHDLAARETIELQFPPAAGRVAVMIAARQSLVTTFLLYQGLAYLGTTAGSWLAALERGDIGTRSGGQQLQRLSGGIEVQIEGASGWQTVGEAYETGPLATDVHLVELPPGATGEHVRLRLPKGGWRIDAAALATLTSQATPIRIAPHAIRGAIGKEYNGGRQPATSFPIVTMPGDAYELEYTLPAGHDYELFLDSRGYYLEWMRQEWMKDEHPLSALRLFTAPAQMLKDLAPAYKKLEPTAEAVFWRSRYARP